MPLSIQILQKAPAGIVATGVLISTADMKKPRVPKGLDVSTKQLKRLGFEGKAGQIQVFSDSKKCVLAVGLGDLEKGKVTESSLYKAGMVLVKNARGFSAVASQISHLPLRDKQKSLQIHIEGLLAGSYQFLAYKSKPESAELKKVVVVAANNSVNAKILKEAKDISTAVAFAKDLVNEPGGSLTPQKFATKAQAFVKKAGLRAKVLNKTAIQNAKMGGLLGVNRGSSNHPRFLEIHYSPPRAKAYLALVGKGVTFDSGGLSIKPADYMMTMKTDMSGAAAVVSAIYAIAKLKLPIKVSAYAPLTDNMLGGDATRPGDVLVTHNKKTIEVLNTDAEGRLILADALSVASKAKPDAILDLATLTGACVVALGEDIAGLMGNSQSWKDQITTASKQTDERVWELPLVDEYMPLLKSDIADMKNIGGRYAGTITAALLLREFVDEKIPWAHLDIAGPAYKESGHGATGFGVRLMVELARNFKKSKVDSN